MAAFGEDVVSVANQLDLDDKVLVGHSLAGDVTVEAALRLEGRVRGLVWVSGHKSLGAPMIAEQIEEWLAPFRTDFVSAAKDLARRTSGHKPSLIWWKGWLPRCRLPTPKQSSRCF